MPWPKGKPHPKTTKEMISIREYWDSLSKEQRRRVMMRRNLLHPKDSYGRWMRRIK